MLLHNLKFYYRNIERDKKTFFINLIGLSIGLTSILLIFLWVNGELNVDKFHENDKQIYAVMSNMPSQNGIETSKTSSGLLAQILKNEIPEIENSTATLGSDWGELLEGVISYDESVLKAKSQFADKNFLDVFTYPFIVGDKSSAFLKKNDVLLSETLAKKMFSTTNNIIGKSFHWKNFLVDEVFTISGIIEDPPQNSSLQFDLLFNLEYLKSSRSKQFQRWQNESVNSYVVVRAGSDIGALNEKITKLVDSKYEHNRYDFFLQQYSRNYLHGNYENGVESGGRIEYVRLFSIIAIFILIIACINFMNLSTASASKRMKEIGIKKVLGSGKEKLIRQFVTESIFTALLALLIATILVVILLPRFSEIAGKNIDILFKPYVVLSILGITILTGLLSSSYPALYLSGFKPVKILKGKLHSSKEELWIRKGLVVFQFLVSIVLIISMVIVNKQISYIQSKDLGYDRASIIEINRDGELKSQLDAFFSELRNTAGVEFVTSSRQKMVGNPSTTTGVQWEGKLSDEDVEFASFSVSNEFIETYGIKIKEGRSYSSDFVSDDTKIIVNETAIEKLHLKNPIGKKLKIWGEEKQIIGVTEDFIFQSFYNTTKPCFIRLMPTIKNKGNYIFIKIQSGEESATIGRISEVYKKFNPGYQFEFNYVEDDYQALYKSENRIASLSKYFAGIAILISCMGIFGLTAFDSQRRIKEIGIRKVHGSSIFEIMRMLSGDFTSLILVAIIIATPLGIFIVKKWLQNFVYRTELSWWIFALAGVLALGIALLTVSFQSWKAATRNPVEALRYE